MYIKEGYYITPEAAERFKIWLVVNHLSMRKFCKNTGCTRQYLMAALSGKIKCTENVRQKFKNGGYELL